MFTSPADPWLASETAALVQRNGLVLRLDGRAMPDPASVFRTFARELSFPGYFGHNWDARVDCLHDWHGPGYGDQDLAILIEHADDLLESDFLGLFVSVLAQAARHANLRLDADGELDEWRQRIAQHFVFLLDRTAPAAFAEQAARGMDVAVALSDGRLLASLTDVDRPGGDPVSAPWVAGPLSFADEEILSGRSAEAVKLFRDRLGCSIHEALDILQSRSEYLRRKAGPAVAGALEVRRPSRNLSKCAGGALVVAQTCFSRCRLSTGSSRLPVVVPPTPAAVLDRPGRLGRASVEDRKTLVAVAVPDVPAVCVGVVIRFAPVLVRIRLGLPARVLRDPGVVVHGSAVHRQAQAAVPVDDLVPGRAGRVGLHVRAVPELIGVALAAELVEVLETR
ncbi:barstar family protein [Streptomyces diastatochromogenes]|nr:barstar family protein [Streptomyces diastatochromogenes]